MFCSRMSQTGRANRTDFSFKERSFGLHATAFGVWRAHGRHWQCVFSACVYLVEDIMQPCCEDFNAWHLPLTKLNSDYGFILKFGFRLLFSIRSLVWLLSIIRYDSDVQNLWMRWRSWIHRIHLSVHWFRLFELLLQLLCVSHWLAMWSWQHTLRQLRRMCTIHWIALRTWQPTLWHMCANHCMAMYRWLHTPKVALLALCVTFWRAGPTRKYATRYVTHVL